MNHYTLFGTEGCHLCEDAAALLVAANLTFESVDIIDDAIAWQRYSTRIPVLLNPEKNQELNWPFDARQLHQFIDRDR
jgi:glutaredoxin